MVAVILRENVRFQNKKKKHRNSQFQLSIIFFKMGVKTLQLFPKHVLDSVYIY